MAVIMVQIGPKDFVPISTRPHVPKSLCHVGVPEGARYGDIITRDATMLPLVIVSPIQLDDGSGESMFSFQHDPSYRIIGSVYESIEPLLPALEGRGIQFNYAAYGIRDSHGTLY